jgi:hypothetical protein
MIAVKTNASNLFQRYVIVLYWKIQTVKVTSYRTKQQHTFLFTNTQKSNNLKLDAFEKRHAIKSIYHNSLFI